MAREAQKCELQAGWAWGSTINNRVASEPEIECGSDAIVANFATAAPFEGHVYVKGHYDRIGSVSPSPSPFPTLLLPQAAVRTRRSREPPPSPSPSTPAASGDSDPYARSSLQFHCWPIGHFCGVWES